MNEYTSPLLSRPAAVPGGGPDAGVPLHYGSPAHEQRALENGTGVVDLSHLGVATVTGPDRLSWLHTLSSQHLIDLAPGDSVSIFSLEAYCAVCRGGSNGGGLDDTLFVYGGGIAEPLEVEILNGNIMVSTEGSAPSANRRVEVYPNPARDRVTVRLDVPSPSGVEVRVYDGRGRLVVGPERHIVGVGVQLFPLSLDGLSAGMYHVEVRSGVGDGRRSHRAVVVLD